MYLKWARRACVCGTFARPAVDGRAFRHRHCVPFMERTELEAGREVHDHGRAHHPACAPGALWP